MILRKVASTQTAFRTIQLVIPRLLQHSLRVKEEIMILIRMVAAEARDGMMLRV